MLTFGRYKIQIRMFRNNNYSFENAKIPRTSLRGILIVYLILCELLILRGYNSVLNPVYGCNIVVAELSVEILPVLIGLGIYKFILDGSIP